MTNNLAIRRKELPVLFSGCSESMWKRIESRLQKRELRKDQVLFSPHDEPSSDYPIFSVIGGDIGLEIPSISIDQDQSLIINLRQPNILFGWPDERSLCTARVRSQTARVITIPHSLFENVLLEEPAVARAIIHLQSERCRPYLKKLQLLMAESTQRVELLLLHIWDGVQKHHIPAPHSSRRPRLRHTQIAEETGLTRETVSRVLGGDDPKIQKLVHDLSPFVVIVARGGKLPESQHQERASGKEKELKIMAEKIVNGLFDRLKIEKKGRVYNRELGIVLNQLLFDLKPGLALTAPEKDVAHDRSKMIQAKN